MRSSLVGTRTRGAGEPYTQDAHVTDAARVRPNCRTPDPLYPEDFPNKMAEGEGNEAGDKRVLVTCPATG
jgi:hypothetical protein